MQTTSRRYYILVGDSETWKVSLHHNLWGFSDKSKGSWNKCNIGDYVAFYVTDPVKKVIGFGTIKRKFIDETVIWSAEKYLFKRALWKYRIELKKIYVTNEWNRGIHAPSGLMLNTGRKMVDKKTFTTLVKEAQTKWKKDFSGVDLSL